MYGASWMIFYEIERRVSLSVAYSASLKKVTVLFWVYAQVSIGSTQSYQIQMNDTANLRTETLSGHTLL